MDISLKTNLMVPPWQYLEQKKDAVTSSRSCATKKMEEEAILPYANNNCVFYRIPLEIQLYLIFSLVDRYFSLD